MPRAGYDVRDGNDNGWRELAHDNVVNSFGVNAVYIGHFFLDTLP